jgi:tripartite-type tricarboxylate transporter receptor subunit TctC
MKKPGIAARIVTACALICMAGMAHAQQDYPVKPITLLIPFPPGTGNDVVGRIVGNKLTEYLGQRVVADNRAGASGNIAIDLARRAAPDGYTLVVASTSFSINLHTMKVSFGLSDFTPVAMIGKLPYTLMVAKSMPARNVRELVDFLKSRQGQHNGGSGGPTGTGFFLLETFKRTAGVDVQLVAYKGTTDGIVDLLAERTHMMFAPMVTSLAHYRAGKIQVHGVTGSKRSALMPDVPTFIESGYPMLDIPTWFALLGPAGLPSGAVKVLSDSVAKALASKDVIDSLVNQGVEPGFGTPAELDAFLKADAAMWSKTVKEAGIKPQ